MEINGSDTDAANPRRCLYKHQLDFVNDSSRFKFWNKSRQIGGTFASAFEVVEDCFERKTDWVVLSASEDTAGEFLKNGDKAETVFRSSLEFITKVKIPVPKRTASDITFYNGSRILALPANPRTARSYSANVVLDEFAHHQNSDLIWDATFPIITNPLHGELKMRVISSPNGNNNLFYQIAHGDNDFSKHRTTVYDAVKNGLKVDIDQLKRNCLTENSWKQNFECEFLDSAFIEPVIPRATIDNCVNNPPLAVAGVRIAFIDFGGGVAETVISVMEGNRIIKIIPWVESDTMKTVGKCIMELSALGIPAQNVFVDASNGTLGHPMSDRLREAGWNVNRVDNGGDAFRKDVFANRGVEIWFDAREEIEKCKVILLEDEKSFSQMSNRGTDYSSSGKMGLENKKKLKTRGVASPDRGDAVCGVISCMKHFFKMGVTKMDNMFAQMEQNKIIQDSRRYKGHWAG